MPTLISKSLLIASVIAFYTFPVHAESCNVEEKDTEEACGQSTLDSNTGLYVCPKKCESDLLTMDLNEKLDCGDPVYISAIITPAGPQRKPGDCFLYIRMNHEKPW